MVSPDVLLADADERGLDAARDWMAVPVVVQWEKVGKFAYPLTIDVGADDLRAPSAALLLLDAYCRARDDPPGNGPAGCQWVDDAWRRADGAFAVPDSAPVPTMLPTWDVAQPPHWKLFSLAGCEANLASDRLDGEAGTVRADLQHLTAHVSRAVAHYGRAFVGAPAKDYCPSQPTVYADFGGHVRQELRELVKGNVVLVGADVTMQPDRLETPVHRSLPGVFLHATAYDNLLRDGTTYRDVRQTWLSHLPAPVLALVLGVLMAMHFNFLFQMPKGWFLDDGCGPKRWEKLADERHHHQSDRLNLNMQSHLNVVYLDVILILLLLTTFLDSTFNLVLLLSLGLVAFHLSLVFTILHLLVLPFCPLWRAVATPTPLHLVEAGVVVAVMAAATVALGDATGWAWDNAAMYVGGPLAVVALHLVGPASWRAVRALRKLWLWNSGREHVRLCSLFEIDLIKNPVKMYRIWWGSSDVPMTGTR